MEFDISGEGRDGRGGPEHERAGACERPQAACVGAESEDYSAFPSEVYLNFTSMHGIQPIVRRIRALAGKTVPAARVPPLEWFKSLLGLETPLDIAPRELPFSVYLISGNAGSGKSTCIQTLNETMDCVITGATRVAAQNVYSKLSAAFASRHVNTIFQEFGFRGNHVQAQLGKYQYACSANPPPIEELQKRDLVYYWEVLVDITRRLLESTASRDEFENVRALERALGRAPGSLAGLAFCTHGSLPAFTRTNVIIIDEAGLLGRHLLTVVVYCWWMINAAYRSPQYADGRVPVVVCVGSPTQTDSLESRFEHKNLKCHVRSSENVLTHIITSRTLREYAALSQNWAIFINNKRCQEYEFGELMKVLEYGLPITEEHMRMVDNFVVPEAYINNPANLPGWTRLYSSHKEVSAYMAKLHAHLKVSGGGQFVVFTLPAYTFVKTAEFEEYKKVTNQPALALDKWLTANASRVSNYSQSRDHDAGRTQCELYAQQGVVVARTDVTYVLNSQVAVTTRMRKFVFGFSGTFESFDAVLKDDAFIKTQGETSVEYAYRFLSTLLFSGMINFYNFLKRPELDGARVANAYERLAALTAELLPGGAVPGEAGAAREEGDALLNFRQLTEPQAAGDDWGEDDVVFAALSEGTIDLLYCNYEFVRPETTPEVYSQFLMLKTMFVGRYAIFSELFGAEFAAAPFDAYVDNINSRGCEIFVGSMRGGISSIALQTDSYTLMGYTNAHVYQFAEDLARRKLHEGIAELLGGLNMPRMVLRDQHGFMSVLNVNLSEFVESVDDTELNMATAVDYGLSSKLAMTIARSQGLSLDKVAICFPRNNLRLNSVYVAMSRTVSSKFLRMNLNPLRERHERDSVISEHILAALRDREVHIVY
ncbi:helicase-primase helicase subunit [Equid alphaherpesvirus 3]|uniref:Helicase-primase helicase subunit n=1 Tax=Equid alphaherpesvirus 3 TaxID=80341 RepID=A0A077B7M8_9ALPH|nr:helicase-primase helicase subunit [Equid alphaherpesvirus 3]AIL02974.1 helicase-primase helicase subunit [Equid alphaherpesvirus 3]